MTDHTKAEFCIIVLRLLILIASSIIWPHEPGDENRYNLLLFLQTRANILINELQGF